MTKHTRAKWAERIREWRTSGLSAEDFAAGKGYEGASLRWAVSQIQPEMSSRSMTEPAARPKAPRRRGAIAKSAVAPAQAPRFLPVRMRRAEPPVAEMIVEVGGARIRVSRGVDVALLGDVVRALQGVGR